MNSDAGSAFRPLDTRSGYDLWSDFYDAEDNPLIALEEPLFADLLGDVRGLAVVDLGCGTGRHSVPLAKAGANVTAVDFSEGMLAQARNRAGAERVRFIAHDVQTPLPLPDACFDRVISCLVLEHVANLPAFFAECGRICRPEGAIVLSTLHPAMMLRGITARFTDPKTGQETRPESHPHQICDFLMGAMRAGLQLTHISEHAIDDAIAARSPRAAKYLGWPMLLLLKFRSTARTGA